MDARCAAEVVDLDAGVVRHRELPGSGDERVGLQQRVGLERGAGLRHTGVLRHHLVGIAQDRLNLNELVAVAGGEPEPHQRGTGGTLSISR